MACNGEKQPLLSGLLDPNALNKRRFRRVKSAPLAEFVPSDISANDSLPLSQSILGGFNLSLRKVAMLLGIYLGMGTLCFYAVRDDIKGKKTNPVLDSIYFCVVTMTTVGYGDLVPDSAIVKLLASLFVFAGMALVGLILSKAADYLLEKQEILLVKTLHMHQKVGPCEIQEEIATNKMRYKCYMAMGILSVLMLIGTFFLFAIEDLDFMDSFYCVCSTITTLGYGDKSFSTGIGRFFAIFWILTGTLGLGQVFLYVAELLTETRQKALAEWVLTRKMTNVDLEAADIDDDGVVRASEFVLYKLKEMGKITQEDIMLVMKEFDDLDVDQSGTLSASDLLLAQKDSRQISD